MSESTSEKTVNTISCFFSQHEVLHLIKPQEKYTLTRDEIQGRLAALDDIHDCVVMIYQACGLDKKRSNFW